MLESHAQSDRIRTLIHRGYIQRRRAMLTLRSEIPRRGSHTKRIAHCILIDQAELQFCDETDRQITAVAE